MPRPIPLVLAVFLVPGPSLPAAPPSATVLPAHAKLHISVPDVAQLDAAWHKTQLSQMAQDPKLKTFLEDLIKESPYAKLGLSWSDLKAAATGELSLSILLFAPGEAGTVLTLDTTGKKDAAAKLQGKIRVSLEKHGYKTGTRDIAGSSVTTYDLAADKKESEAMAFQRRILIVMKDETLLAADSDKTVEEVLRRWAGQAADRLDQQKPYQEVQARTQAKCKTARDVFWFMEPLGLAEAKREKPARGRDTLKILGDEGFTAFQGIGGYLCVGLEEYEFLHYTAFYAPPPFRKSMRILRTLPGATFTPQAWVPADVTTFATLYLDVAGAFNYVGSFFDAFYADGDAGTFDDIIKGLRDDPNGPQVDVTKDVIGKLGQRVTVVTDTVQPIDLYSSRTLIAVEAKDEKALARAIRLLMENDDDVKRRDLKGEIVVWETVTKEKKKKKGAKDKGAKPAAPAPKAPNGGVAVAHGQLFMASHVKHLEEILTRTAKSLAGAADYQRVVRHLDKLGAGKDCLRSFSRADEDLQTAFEMLRTNQLDKSKSLYSRALLALLGDNAKQIDGSAFPPYEHFRPYLGPTGLFGDNQTDGWFYVGFSLRKK